MVSFMGEKIINVDGNEIIISVEGLDDIEIEDIILEDAEDPEGDLVITAKILEVGLGEVYPAVVVIEDGMFKEVIPIITDDDDSLDLDYEGVLIPGLIDSHIHIESSKLSPSHFAKAVIPYGTTSVIADSHEIANVLGVEGIDFMIEDGKKVPFDFYYAAPSSVPATPFETSGAILNGDDVAELLKRDEMVALGEMMNFQDVLAEDEEVIKRLDAAKSLGKPIDGHAPSVSGEDLRKYVSWGISTDHECSNFAEAVEKKKAGMKIMVREGSLAKDMDTLFNIDDRLNYLIEEEMAGNIIVDNIDESLTVPPFDFLVCDNIDARDLSKGHLNNLIKKAISLKINPKEAIKMVTLNPAEHYGLNCGAIETGRIANFALVDDLRNLNVSKVWVHGDLVFDEGEVLFEAEEPVAKNSFDLNEVTAEDFDVLMEMDWVNSLMDETTNVYVMEAYDGELLTGKSEETLLIHNKVIQRIAPHTILKQKVFQCSLLEVFFVNLKRLLWYLVTQMLRRLNPSAILTLCNLIQRLFFNCRPTILHIMTSLVLHNHKTVIFDVIRENILIVLRNTCLEDKNACLHTNAKEQVLRQLDNHLNTVLIKHIFDQSF